MMLVLDRRAAGGAWRSRTRSQAGDEAGRVEIWEVSVSFRQGSTVNHALENTSVDIAPGSFVCLLGPSGCGKSTLLNTVAGYVRPTTGWARVDGVQVLGPGSDRGPYRSDADRRPDPARCRGRTPCAVSGRPRGACVR